MTFLVADAALDGCVDAEDVVDGLPERLAAIEDDEHALVDIEAAAGEVRQQRRRDGGVLGGPVPEPQGVLDAVAVDAEADDAAAALELDAVEHHHRQAQVRERPRHQIDEVLARARNELAADGRLRRRPGDLVDAAADRLTGPRVAARRDAGQHPLEHHVGELVTGREVRIGVQLDLALAVGGPGARPADRHPAAPEHDLAALVAVADRGAVGIVSALRADDLVDLGFHDLVQHAQADTDAQRQQPFLRRAGQLTQRVLNPLRQPLDTASADYLVGDVIYGSHSGPPVSMDLFALATLPAAADEAGGPPSSSSTGEGTNPAAPAAG